MEPSKRFSVGASLRDKAGTEPEEKAAYIKLIDEYILTEDGETLCKLVLTAKRLGRSFLDDIAERKCNT